MIYESDTSDDRIKSEVKELLSYYITDDCIEKLIDASNSIQGRSTIKCEVDSIELATDSISQMEYQKL